MSRPSSTTPRARSPSPTPVNMEEFNALTSLTAGSDRGLRNGLETLLFKERKLAELGILLALSSTSRGGSALTGSSAAHHARASGLPSSLASLPPPGASGCLVPSQDPTRLPASAFSPHPSLPSGLLRPSCGRAEVSPQEAALLAGALPSAKCGLDLSGLALGDELGGAGALEALGRAVGPSSSLRALDLRNCHLGAQGASAALTLVAACAKGLAAVSLEGNALGGGQGLGALVEALAHTPHLAHLGLTLCDAPPLPPQLAAPEPVWPPEAAAAKPAGGKAATGTSAKKPAGAAAGAGAGSSAAAAAAAAQPAIAPELLLTTAYLLRSLRAAGAAGCVSISLAQSALTRASLARFLSFWTPPHILPTPKAAAAHPPAGAPAPSAAAGADKKKTAPAPAKKDPKAAAAAAAAAASPAAATPAPPYLMALSLAATHLGSLSASDLALALGPPKWALAATDSNALLGVVDVAGAPVIGAAGAGAAGAGGKKKAAPAPAAAKAGSKAAGGGATATGAAAALPLFNPTLHGSLLFLRVLDLSSCDLTSHGILPLVEALGFHCAHLSHLSLAHNAIDDSGALLLAQAVLHNAARVEGLQRAAGSGSEGDAAAAAAAAAALTSTEPLAHAMGHTLAHTTPLRVLDVTGNPLTLSADGISRPGCSQLLQALEATPSLLTLTGPLPSPLSLLAMRAGVESAAATATPWGSSASGGGGGGGGTAAAAAALPSSQPTITSPTQTGWGDFFPIDLAAILSACAAAASGDAATPSCTGAQHRLAMPGSLAHAACAVTAQRVRGLLQQGASPATAVQVENLIAGSSTGGSAQQQQQQQQEGQQGAAGAGAGVEDDVTTLWSLPRPQLTASSTRPLTGNALALSLPPAPAASTPSPHAWRFGCPCLQFALPAAGQGSHLSADWVHSSEATGGIPRWHLGAPCLLLEWRGTVSGAPAEALAAAAPFLALTWSVLLGSGGGGEGLQHVASVRAGEGSSDRMAARALAVERHGRGRGAGGSAAAAAAAALAAEGPLSSTRPPSAAASGALHAWTSTGAAAVSFQEQPFPLGDHATGGGASGAVLGSALCTSALAASAMAAAEAAVATWPLVWHAVVLPHECLSSLAGGEAAVSVYGSLAQKTVKNVGGVCSSPAGAAHPLCWTVQEAHLVLLGAGERAGGRAAALAPQHSLPVF